MTTKIKASAEITFDPMKLTISGGYFEEDSVWTVVFAHRYDSHYMPEKWWTIQAYIVDETELRELLMEEFNGIVEKYSHVSIETEEVDRLDEDEEEEED